MSDLVANQVNEPATQLQDIINPATFVPPDSQPTPRITIEFCDRVRRACLVGLQQY